MRSTKIVIIVVLVLALLAEVAKADLSLRLNSVRKPPKG